MARNLAERNIAARRQASENITSAADAYRSMGQQHLENLGQVRSQQEALRQRREDRRARAQDAKQKELQRLHEKEEATRDRELEAGREMREAKARIMAAGGTELEVLEAQLEIAHGHDLDLQANEIEARINEIETTAEQQRETATHESEIQKGVLKYETVLQDGLNANTAERALTQMREQFKLARSNQEEATAQEQLHEMQLMKLEMSEDAQLRITLLKMELRDREERDRLERASREGIETAKNVSAEARARIQAGANEAAGVDDVYAKANLIMQMALGENQDRLFAYDYDADAYLPTYLTDDSVNFDSWGAQYKKLMSEDRLNDVISDLVVLGAFKEGQRGAMVSLVGGMANVEELPGAAAVGSGQVARGEVATTDPVFRNISGQPLDPNTQDKGTFINEGAGRYPNQYRIFSDDGTYIPSKAAEIQRAGADNISEREAPVLARLTELLELMSGNPTTQQFGPEGFTPSIEDLQKLGEYLRRMYATKNDEGLRGVEAGVEGYRNRFGLDSETVIPG